MAADGFGERPGAGGGRRSWFVDLVYGFTDRDSPLYCDAAVTVPPADARAG
jgi:hypothetical protein